jgi:hypothetical protein
MGEKTMKKISMLLAVIGCAFAQLAFANSAIVTSLTGTATARTGNAAPRTLRQGDEVSQGMTVATGANSSAVLRFSDGQVAALSGNSQMQITAYQYEQQTGTGNVLLSLISGGMRAITGLIGKASPNKVSYRAATATIGIRGTDVLIIAIGGDVTVTVSEGSISFTFAGKTLIVPAGQGVNAKKDGTFQQSAAAEAIAKGGKEIADAVKGLESLAATIQQASKGSGTEGNKPQGEGQGNGAPTSVPGVGNGGTPGAGGAGGGGPSKV